MSIYQSGCDTIHLFLSLHKKTWRMLSCIKDVGQTGKLSATLYPSLWFTFCSESVWMYTICLLNYLPWDECLDLTLPWDWLLFTFHCLQMSVSDFPFGMRVHNGSTIRQSGPVMENDFLLLLLKAIDSCSLLHVRLQIAPETKIHSVKNKELEKINKLCLQVQWAIEHSSSRR